MSEIDAPRPEKGVYMCYDDRPITRRSMLAIIDGINAILVENEPHPMTIRAIHYQFVAKGWLPNDGKTYDAISAAANRGRMAGMISWTHIEDLGRNLYGLSHEESPLSAVEKVRAGYRIDMWANQRFRPEAWVEKQAQQGTVGRIAQELEIDYYATRGYDSQSQAWRAARRFQRYISKGQVPVILYFGDLDPSGWHITENIRERLRNFTGVDIMVVRVGLNIDQVEQYNPPPNPVKRADSRSPAYRAQFGDTCWEMDALRPAVIHDLFRAEVEKLRDPVAWDARKMVEVEDKRILDEMIELAGGRPPEDDEPGAGEDED